MGAILEAETEAVDRRTLQPVQPLDAERRQLLEAIASGTYDSFRRDLVGRCLGEDAEARDALRRLLLHVDRYLDVLRTRKFYPAGSRGYMSVLAGLIAVAFHHRKWRITGHQHVVSCGHPRWWERSYLEGATDCRLRGFNSRLRRPDFF